MTDEEIVESIIQIASSFGISCDDASYIVKSFENFGKEYMMSNIEDDLKEKGFIEGYKQMKNNASIIKSIDREFFFELVDYLLEEREQDKARIKELEAKLEFKKYGDLDEIEFEEYMSHFIPKQKVKDKIEDIKKGNYSSNYNFKGGRENGKNFKFGFKVGMLKALKELLEEGE